MIRVAVLAVALASCSPDIVDLGRLDAAVDAPPDATIDAAASCRCRIAPCRTAGDCALIGGACGPDLYCVGDFGPCVTDGECHATTTSSVCTTGATSTTPCP